MYNGLIIFVLFSIYTEQRKNNESIIYSSAFI